MSLAERIDWQKSPLVGTIAQDAKSKEVLMFAFSNKEAIDLSLKSGYVHYYSRSKQRIWKKGEQSGHTQKILQARLDCDNDAVLYFVEQTGAACHTGRKSCFFQDLATGAPLFAPSFDVAKIYGAVDRVYETIQERKLSGGDNSYVSSLFKGGENAIYKKIAEEAGEFLLALKDKNEQEIIHEACDLLFHSMVGLAGFNIAPDRIRAELLRREGTSGIAEKQGRKK